MRYQSSSKKMVQLLVEQCYNYGIKHVIISPGSRNAPLIISFDNHPAFACYSIPDERSAAFYGLGMARQLKEPVALICTSGTAVLNYAPALTEAFYQEIPLIAITADRPPELIGQEDGQTIKQDHIFKNNIKYSVTLPMGEDAESLTLGIKKIQTSFKEALQIPQGPVHINIPMAEPLYDAVDVPLAEKRFPELADLSSNISEAEKKKILEIWNASSKIMILCGIMPPNKELSKLFSELVLQKNVVVLAPPTSNLSNEQVFSIADSLFASIKSDEIDTFKPDLLITIGGPVISKNTKVFLRNNPPKFHFDIDSNPNVVNTYNCLTANYTTSPKVLAEYLLTEGDSKNSTYLNLWVEKSKIVSALQNDFISTSKWSDLKVYDIVFKGVNSILDLHLANSTPVRYAELFPTHPNINYYANRGASGIDGCTSSAAGAALASDTTTLLITGDISFIYDSNAFWNKHVPSNLKVILINNDGGNIFKVIPGPGTTAQLEQHFVTHQTAKAEKICEAFDIAYLSATNEQELTTQFEELLISVKCTVLEVFTPSDLSSLNFKGLLAHLKK